MTSRAPAMRDPRLADRFGCFGWICCRCMVVFCALFLGAPPSIAQEVIQSASELDYPPYSIVTEDGQADGFAVEMLRESLRFMGREVRFKIGPWHKIKDDLAAGRIQVLPLVARTEERQAIYDFTAPYLNLHGSIVVRKGDRRIRGTDGAGALDGTGMAELGSGCGHQRRQGAALPGPGRPQGVRGRPARRGRFLHRQGTG